ncbi:MAG TPA: hypothetical protein VMB25_19575 [Bryobacteraceae bacterium]|nr:hypothetical protein [Bryobacteraceae bacterium]
MKDFLLVAALLTVPVTASVYQYQAPAAVDKSDPRLCQLQEFFSQRQCPLRDSAEDFLLAADQNNLDWRLLPSISIVESSGGKDYRNNNVLGWASCKEKFPTVQAGIHYVAAQLARSKNYRNKNLEEKLQTYNPHPEYPGRIRAVMRSLAATQLPHAISAN